MKGFETFMESLTNKNFRSNMHGSGVDLVLSCVDNYEARMVVNQVIATTITKYICFIFLGSALTMPLKFSIWLMDI